MISAGTSPSVSHPEGNTQTMMQTEPLGSGGSGSVWLLKIWTLPTLLHVLCPHRALNTCCSEILSYGGHGRQKVASSSGNSLTVSLRCASLGRNSAQTHNDAPWPGESLTLHPPRESKLGCLSPSFWAPHYRHESNHFWVLESSQMINQIWGRGGTLEMDDKGDHQTRGCQWHCKEP